MPRVDLNVDIGEGFPYDVELLQFATSANVACAAHAGSWELTLETLELCRSTDTRVGMHPGYPNREQMGRTRPDMPWPELRESLLEQARRFAQVACPAYLKPHGAWYNEIVGSPVGDTAEVAEEIAREYSLPVMILPIAQLSVPTLREGFADRAYEPDGSLRPRSVPGAVLQEPKEVAAQVRWLAPQVDSICLHGDTPDALEFAELVARTLRDAGYEVGW